MQKARSPNATLEKSEPLIAALDVALHLLRIIAKLWRRQCHRSSTTAHADKYSESTPQGGQWPCQATLCYAMD